MITPALSVGRTPDLDRVLALPRRAEATPEEIAAWSGALRRPGATCELRPRQCEALRDLYWRRGLFAPIRVGGGKTLITLLAALVMSAERPVLVVPGGATPDKTRADFTRYHAEGWRVTLPEIVTYNELGRDGGDERLLAARPDLLILDEAHKCRNLDAACTRKLRRAVESLRPIVAALSGTLITDQLMDYWHLLGWALGPGAPVPALQVEAEAWAKALDRRVGLLERMGLGALELLPGGFADWMRGTAGVVPTAGSGCHAAIEIRPWRPELPAVITGALAYVDETRCRPDGEPLDDWGIADVKAQLAQGFYYVWDPLPPDWWLAPRRGWAMYERAVLDEHAPGLDSGGQLRAAIDRGDRAVPALQEGRELLEMWRGVRPRFEPNRVPVWLDDAPLRQAAQCEPGTLIWTRHRAVGERLQALGVPYWGAGTNPEHAPHGHTIAVSVSAHHQVFNLQHGWSRNLYPCPMAKAELWEQSIGRTHREGQAAPIVHVSIAAAIDYHESVIGRVFAEAGRISADSGFEQKLLAARWIGW